MCDAVNDKRYSYNFLEYVCVWKGDVPCLICMYFLGYQIGLKTVFFRFRFQLNFRSPPPPPLPPSYFSGSSDPGHWPFSYLVVNSISRTKSECRATTTTSFIYTIVYRVRLEGNSPVSLCMFLFSFSFVRWPWPRTKHIRYWNANEQLTSKNIWLHMYNKTMCTVTVCST